MAPLLFDQSFLPSKRQCLKPVKPCNTHVDGDVLGAIHHGLFVMSGARAISWGSLDLESC